MTLNVMSVTVELPIYYIYIARTCAWCDTSKQVSLLLLLQLKCNYQRKLGILCSMTMKLNCCKLQCTLKEIIEKILDLELVKVSYDSQNNEVIDIDQI